MHFFAIESIFSRTWVGFIVGSCNFFKCAIRCFRSLLFTQGSASVDNLRW